ncbi:hypothetical protein [Candidatus Poriferisodalis sp.]|uniref:hypothetical protein n=1 Tax=Candidatus Poriferisodalis sp. TaxID=3101277 RepID=UPI003AF768DE
MSPALFIAQLSDCHEEYPAFTAEGGTIAKNGDNGGGRNGAAKGRSQFQNPKNGNWTKRDASSGRFMAMKRTGGPFKGVRREH